jgi:hypothetical protein
MAGTVRIPSTLVKGAKDAPYSGGETGPEST